MKKSKIKAELHCPSIVFQTIRDHVLQNDDEQAGFMFLGHEVDSKGHRFTLRDYYLVQKPELIGDNAYHIEIADETFSRMIMQAAKGKLVLCEMHSHPLCDKGVKFSGSDFYGFKECVPHIWWRLNNRPYLAIVFGKSDFDALVWHQGPDRPSKLDRVVLDGKTTIRPTQRSIKLLEASHEKRGKYERI